MGTGYREKDKKMINPAVPPDYDQELHLTKYQANGHVMSTDCWCEPSLMKIMQLPDLPGRTLVVQHVDDTAEHHLTVITERQKNPDWITKILSSINKGK